MESSPVMTCHPTSSAAQTCLVEQRPCRATQDSSWANATRLMYTFVTRVLPNSRVQMCSASVNWKLHFCLSTCLMGYDFWTPVCIGIKGQKHQLACLPGYFFSHFSFCRTTQRYAKGSREMAEPLGALVALTGDSSSVLSIHMVTHNHQ